VNGTWTVFGVFRASTTSIGNPRILNYQDTPNGVAQFLYIESGRFNSYIWASPPVQLTGSTVALNTSYITSVVNATNNTILYLNGTSNAAVNHGTNTTVSNSTYWIGGFNSGSDRFYGTLNELIVFSNNLSESQRQQAEGYLAWKWGLQSSLPSTHPYKTSLIPPLLNPPTTLPLVRQNPVSFVPTQISGCGLWLDGADTTTLTYQSGNNVSIWTDKSAGIQAQFLTNAMAAARWTPGGNSVGSTGATNYPVSGSNINGVNALYFNQAVLQAITTQNVNTRSYFLVFQLPSNSTGPGDNILWPATWVNGFARGASLSVDSSNFTLANQNVANLLFLNVSPKNPTLVSVTFNNGTPGMWNAGGGTTTATGQSSSSLNLSGSTDNYLWIGGASGIFSSTGFILGEFLEYNSALLTSQRQQIEGYLAWKWGLQANLPTNHPYKAGPPYSATITAPSRSLGIAGTWNPTLISGCSLWLDAADRNTLTVSGSNVSSWRDKSGNNNNATQATVANQPTTGTLLNGLNVLNFTGTQPYFSFPTISYTNITVFTIFRNTTLRAYSSPLFIGPFFFFYTNGAGNSVIGTGRLGVNDEGVISQAAAGITTTNYLLYSLNLTVGATDIVNFYINGTNAANFNGAASGGRSYYQVGSTDGVGATTGFTAEILVYNGVLNNSQRQQVEGYLAWKWGLQGSLPATHPFKNWPPAP
jgi:hypothetical protein